ncbi:acyl-CoA N-acyltransferase [Catenaria anguillulae PL171]|uniref:Glucosamine 6-phosphate N-acetyltransferase n=1 Tax=Catenaria anguillulae PL171 TaxID=765915 RepID=A0A1Y2H6I5_9FUNG|nr:acyl-CoA N-acyltransferase [Catenaria anguillulae PL171]
MIDAKFISEEVAAQLPTGYVLRALDKEDFDKGYMQLLAQLTVVGDVSREQFDERLTYLAKHNDTYYPLVIEDRNTGKVVGAGTLFVERKFIRGCGMVGHIEDIVVDENQRGKKLGLRIIHALTHVGKVAGCYKIILNCNKDNIPFYEKTGFALKEVEMAKYLNE